MCALQQEGASGTELVGEYDPHMDLRKRIHELEEAVSALETRYWQLKDAFYVHDHGDPEMQDMVKEHLRRLG